MPYKNLINFAQVVKKLRSKNGCPWDRKQTHKSLKPYLIEETYEVLEAIDQKKPAPLKEELGDLLLQIFLHAQIASDQKKFTIDDVASEISQKMIRRHPHVFGNTKVKGAKDVVKNWDEIKKQEKAAKGIKEKSALDNVPKNMPSLFENHQISKKVAKLGFDWQKPEHVFKKVNEEIREVKAAVAQKDKKHIEEELGDLLFTVANLCRVYGVNPELCLKKANQKFRKRFGKMESKIKRQKKSFKDLNFKDWNALWTSIK